MRLSPRKLVLLSVFVAFAIILKRILTINLPVGIICFSGFPIIMAGLLFGPAAGGIAGAVSDILGYPLCPAGPYSPLFTFTAALTGIIPALILRNHSKERLTFWVLTLAIFAGQFVTKVLLVPFFLQVQFGIPFAFKSSSNLIVELIHAPFYAVLGRSLIQSFGYIFPSEPPQCVHMADKTP